MSSMQFGSRVMQSVMTLGGSCVVIKEAVYCVVHRALLFVRCTPK